MDDRVGVTRRQWDRLADAYLESPTHARGEDLETVMAFADPKPADVALDLGCGVGHTLRRLAPHVRMAVGADAGAAFREAHRVLRAEGRLVLSDNYAPDDEALDRFINTLEATRDPSHVREHTVAGWRGLLEDAGFEVTDESRGTIHVETEPWLARSRTPASEAELRAVR